MMLRASTSSRSRLLDLLQELDCQIRERECEACAQVVADAVDHREPASTYVGKIKEHFGVE